MSKIITLEEVVTEAEKLVAEFGEDYKYEYPKGRACVYQVNGEPSCIVGHLINRLDPEDFPKLVEFENRHDTESFSISQKDAGLHGTPTPSEKIRKHFTSAAFLFLDIVQTNQDCGKTWSEAVKIAKTKTGGGIA